ncbi:hypothetical protein HY478_01980 [Candidatus Uhrbacteria bacterium]|nr:hypothetical protein [Candidatus Uhrbacteria bacterium]
MSHAKKLTADFLFAVHVIGALVLGVSQFVRMLSTLQGVSLSMFLSFEAFLAINLFLAIRAHKVQPSRVTAQTILSYALWIVLIALDLAAIAVNGTYQWSTNDTVTLVLVGIGVVGTFLVGVSNSRSVNDPIVKAWFAVFFKAMPQLLLAAKIFQFGGAGTPGAAIVSGHCTILTRIGQLIFAIREAGWDRNRVGLVVSETANELSWVVVTIIWLFR